MKRHNEKRDAEEKAALSPDAIMQTSNDEFAEELKDLKAAHDRRAPKVQLATIAASTVSITLSSMGMMNKLVESSVADTIGLAVCFFAALAAGMVLTLATLQLFNIAMSAARTQRFKVVALTIGLMLPVLAISTSFAVMQTAGSPSLVMDMEDKAEQWDAYFEQSVSFAERSLDAHDTLLPLKHNLEELSAEEKKSGILSGRAGAGAIAAAYRSSAISISSILDTTQQTIDATETRRDKATELIAALRHVPKDTALGIFERQASFADIAGKLDALINASGRKNTRKTLNAQLGIMQKSVASLDVADGSFGKKQGHAVQNLKSMVGEVITIMSELMADDTAIIVSKPAPLLDMNRAMIAYYDRNIQQWLLAAMLDLMPIYFCLMLMLSKDIQHARAREFQTA